MPPVSRNGQTLAGNGCLVVQDNKKYFKECIRKSYPGLDFYAKRFYYPCGPGQAIVPLVLRFDHPCTRQPCRRGFPQVANCQRRQNDVNRYMNNNYILYIYIWYMDSLAMFIIDVNLLIQACPLEICNTVFSRETMGNLSPSVFCLEWHVIPTSKTNPWHRLVK